MWETIRWESPVLAGSAPKTVTTPAAIAAMTASRIRSMIRAVIDVWPLATSIRSLLLDENAAYPAVAPNQLLAERRRDVGAGRRCKFKRCSRKRRARLV